jgi:hypothetical protein
MEGYKFLFFIIYKTILRNYKSRKGSEIEVTIKSILVYTLLISINLFNIQLLFSRLIGIRSSYYSVFIITGIVFVFNFHLLYKKFATNPLPISIINTKKWKYTFYLILLILLIISTFISMPIINYLLPPKI